jgi:L-lactate utilization protein LutC
MEPPAMNAVTPSTESESVPLQTRFTTLAEDHVIERTRAALEANGFEVFVVDSGAEAKAKILELIPEGAEVMTNTSKTLDEIGISSAINESGKYDAIRPKLMALFGDPTKKREQRKIAAAPDYALGSVHAITETGDIVIASGSGSQIGQYPYAAGKVIFVAGTHKIVSDIEEAHRRLKEHALPLENQRMQGVYGRNSAIKKVLTIHGDAPGRFTLVLIREHLGF